MVMLNGGISNYTAADYSDNPNFNGSNGVGGPNLSWTNPEVHNNMINAALSGNKTAMGALGSNIVAMGGGLSDIAALMRAANTPRSLSGGVSAEVPRAGSVYMPGVNVSQSVAVPQQMSRLPLPNVTADINPLMTTDLGRPGLLQSMANPEAIQFMQNASDPSQAIPGYVFGESSSPIAAAMPPMAGGTPPVMGEQRQAPPDQGMPQEQAPAPPQQQAPAQAGIPAPPQPVAGAAPPQPDILPTPSAPPLPPTQKPFDPNSFRAKADDYEDAAPAPAPPRMGPSPWQNFARTAGLMMSPHAKQWAQQAALAKQQARGALSLEAFKHENDMEKLEREQELIGKREMAKFGLEQQAKGKMSDSEKLNAEREFWGLSPNTQVEVQHRANIAQYLPHLAPHILDPQDPVAAAKATKEAVGAARDALDYKHKAATIDEEILQAKMKSTKDAIDIDQGQLNLDKGKATYAADVKKANVDAEQAYNDLQLSIIENPMKALERVNNLHKQMQDIANFDVQRQREIKQDYENTLKTLGELKFNASGTPAAQIVDQAIYALVSGSNDGVPKPTVDPKTHKRVPPQTPPVQTTPMMQNLQQAANAGRAASGQPMQAGIQYSPPGQPQQATTAGFIPPPPPIMPNIIQPPPGMDPMQYYQQAVNFSAQALDPKMSRDGLGVPSPGVPMPPPQVQQAVPQQAAPAQPQQIAAPPQAQPPGPLTFAPGFDRVAQSLQAGHWVGDTEPTPQERLRMGPSVAMRALGEAVRPALGGIESALTGQRSATGDAVNPFVTPQSRGQEKGAKLTDPELIHWFALKGGSQEGYEKLIKQAGWTPIADLQTLKQETKEQPIKSQKIIDQAFSTGYKQFLTPAQLQRFADADEQRKKARFLSTASGKHGFNLFPAPQKPPSIAQRGR